MRGRGEGEGQRRGATTSYCVMKHRGAEVQAEVHVGFIKIVLSYRLILCVRDSIVWSSEGKILRRPRPPRLPPSLPPPPHFRSATEFSFVSLFVSIVDISRSHPERQHEPER